ncbi:erythromycin esterase family protein [Tumebacillus permanentifrigoris]|uniref:Erythromycin esterase-like protein n=1 Tax=Tumebacillus permanentifrigoris TaxID=378543 RepID=A0A316D8T8_9BACL|nr:erythromycin esterase family protein [Tumebacillus permanentifrigoris]PWK13402.1 erythromycin esterase-like protein [Tumebacillus permanentifrigoris]
MNKHELIHEIRKASIRLDSHDDLDALVDAVGDAQIVLLGEASHGTSEFYSLRMELSKRLIERKGFSFLAVEGDWPSCYSLNRYVKNAPDAPATVRDAQQSFNRWPTWMWANRETAELAEWLRDFNTNRSEQERVGFYGLDMYSLWESMEAVIKYLEETNAPELIKAKRAFACFEPYSQEGQTYGMAATYLSETCEEEVVKLLTTLQERRFRDVPDQEAELSAELNALVAVNAERYYRSMVRGGNDSWNIRDTHMVDALNQLMKFHGQGAKAIIWEHNTHIGDARATDMAREGMVNVGQLVREQYGRENCYAIGFGTHRGTVIAAREWGAPLEVLPVPEALHNSWEDMMHRAGAHNQILFLGPENPYFQTTVGHRAIGVVYYPEYERGNYVPSNMAQRYDAFVYVDETHALEPMVVEEVIV